MADVASFSKNIGTVRNILCYNVDTQIGPNDYYYEDITNGNLINYQNKYAGVGYFYIPASTGSYGLHIMIEGRELGLPILGTEIVAAGSTFYINVIRGVVRGQQGNVDYRYTDGRTFPTGAWYKIGWWWNTGSGTNSRFYVNNSMAEIQGVPTGDTPHPVGSQLLFNNNTPAGFKVGSLIVLVDPTLTEADAGALQFLGGAVTPVYAGQGPYTNTGKIKTIYIDNGPTQLKNQVTGTTWRHKLAGTVPTPVSHQQTHIIIP